MVETTSTKQGPGRGSKTPPNMGKGRPAGLPNKITRSAREAFQHAFDHIGGAENLATWARDNETDFYKLFARLIPVQQEHSGQLTVQNVTRRIIDPKAL